MLKTNKTNYNILKEKAKNFFSEKEIKKLFEDWEQYPKTYISSFTPIVKQDYNKYFDISKGIDNLYLQLKEHYNLNHMPGVELNYEFMRTLCAAMLGLMNENNLSISDTRTIYNTLKNFSSCQLQTLCKGNILNINSVTEILTECSTLEILVYTPTHQEPTNSGSDGMMILPMDEPGWFKVFTTSQKPSPEFIRDMITVDETDSKYIEKVKVINWKIDSLKQSFMGGKFRSFEVDNENVFSNVKCFDMTWTSCQNLEEFPLINLGNTELLLYTWAGTTRMKKFSMPNTSKIKCFFGTFTSMGMKSDSLVGLDYINTDSALSIDIFLTAANISKIPTLSNTTKIISAFGSFGVLYNVSEVGDLDFPNLIVGEIMFAGKQNYDGTTYYSNISKIGYLNTPKLLFAVGMFSDLKLEYIKSINTTMEKTDEVINEYNSIMKDIYKKACVDNFNYIPIPDQVHHVRFAHMFNNTTITQRPNSNEQDCLINNNEHGLDYNIDTNSNC